MKFSDRVYEIVRKIPEGKVMTYKQIAEKLNTKAYQAIGQALKKNPYAPEVPCHRVVKSDGNIGGFFGQIKGKEIERKTKLLESEGIKIINGKVDEFEKVKS